MKTEILQVVKVTHEETLFALWTDVGLRSQLTCDVRTNAVRDHFGEEQGQIKLVTKIADNAAFD